MNPYPKRILTIPQQLQSYTDAGMTIFSVEEATAALTTIGYYRLRGYSFHLYDNASRQYRPGTDFSDILNLYHFDTELSRLLFGMATCIEVALRALALRGRQQVLHKNHLSARIGAWRLLKGILCPATSICW